MSIINGLRRRAGDTVTLRATVGIILVGLGCLATSTAAEETIRLSVMYEGSKLSVEARGVSLTEVLRAIGTKVGFTVIDNGLARSPRTLTLKELTLDVILQQLLASENHVVVYRTDDGGMASTRIETIVLLESPPNHDAKVEPLRRLLDTPGAVSPLGSQVPDEGLSPSARLSEQQPGTIPQIGGETSQSAAEPVAGSSPFSIAPSPQQAPDPDRVRQQILERVKTMVDAVRRATLDHPRSNP